MEPRDESLLQDLLDDRLDETAAAAVRARLEAEPDLRDAFEELQGVGRLVRGEPSERAPRDFLSGVRARIASLPPDDAEDPPLPRLAAWRRAAVAASAIAALLLVAVAVRLMFGGGMPRPDAPAVESARAEAPEALDRDDEELALREARPEGAPRGASAAPVPDPPPAAGGFGPGDAVPPGLREPHDSEEEEADALEVKARRARSGLLRPADGPPAARTLVLRAQDYAAGRAQLALLVSGLQTTGTPAEKGAARAPVFRSVDALRKDVGADVLGSVVLTLSPETADALVRLGRLGEPDGRSDAYEPSAPAGPATPAAPPPEPVRPEDASGAEPEAEPGGKDAADVDKAEAAEKVRLRIVFVRDR